jgi:hypothetical protein
MIIMAYNLRALASNYMEQLNGSTSSHKIATKQGRERKKSYMVPKNGLM